MHQHYGAINGVYHAMGIDFTERCHVLSTRVMESLHERSALLCEGYLPEPQYFRKFHSQSRVKTRHLNTDQRNLSSRSVSE